MALGGDLQRGTHLWPGWGGWDLLHLQVGTVGAVLKHEPGTESSFNSFNHPGLHCSLLWVFVKFSVCPIFFSSLCTFVPAVLFSSKACLWRPPNWPRTTSKLCGSTSSRLGEDSYCSPAEIDQRSHSLSAKYTASLEGPLVTLIFILQMMEGAKEPDWSCRELRQQSQTRDRLLAKSGWIGPWQKRS